MKRKDRNTQSPSPAERLPSLDRSSRVLSYTHTHTHTHSKAYYKHCRLLRDGNILHNTWSTTSSTFHPKKITAIINKVIFIINISYEYEQLHLIVYKEATALPDILTSFTLPWSSFSSSIWRQGLEDHVVIWLSKDVWNWFSSSVRIKVFIMKKIKSFFNMGDR